ncbi:hypothetical protein RDI58_029360 [Solanum bulbocastanum]|uniref:Uncharacterized protein n=1 Tax=Solanum bulbocastanum TaxID=147425 RepID=A0AAN8SWE9_SOLBU
MGGCSLGNFLRGWSMVARDSEAKLSSQHQYLNHPILHHFKWLLILINSAESETQTSPTTVEAITTFLYKCVNNTPNFMPSLLIQAVDQCGASNDALVPADLTGNAILPFVVSATNKEEMNLQRLVSELRKGKREDSR